MVSPRPGGSTLFGSNGSNIAMWMVREDGLLPGKGETEMHHPLLVLIEKSYVSNDSPHFTKRMSICKIQFFI